MPANETAQNSLFRKYRAIVVAIALFVAIDVALIAFNLVATFRIDRHAASRDLAGAVQSTSPAVLLSLLELQETQTNGVADAAARQRLRSRLQTINAALPLLENGGRALVPADSPEVAGADTPELRDAIGRFKAVWTSYRPLLEPLAAGAADAAAVDRAVAQGRENDEMLFGAIDAFTAERQRLVAAETHRLRLAQVVGLGFALLNVLFTLLLAFRRLLAGDRAVERSRKETADILSTVKEGLFLITPDHVVGDQMSGSLKDILRKDVAPGSTLFAMLEPLVPADALGATRDYVELLFGKRVKESLAYSLNPLSEVAVGTDGQPRWLSFQFNRVLDGGDVSHLLVTVQDATERANLARQLSEAKARARTEMEAMLRVLGNDPADVRDFLHRTESALGQINDSLRQVSRRSGEHHLELVNAVFRSVHGIKSEAATLDLEMFESIAHEFESGLVALRDRGEIEGGDMVRLTLHLDDLFECVAGVQALLSRLSNEEGAERSRATRFVEAVRSLAQRVAGDQRKRVEVVADVAAMDALSEAMAEEIRGIGLQLLRNAISHGIETPEERRRRGKRELGVVEFRCRRLEDGMLEFAVRDDGRGISPARVRAALLASGRYPAEAIDALGDREVLLKIFEPGVTTLEASTRDAGHGAGMDMVRDRVGALAGRLSLSTVSHSHTEFRMRFPLPGATPAAPAEQAS